MVCVPCFIIPVLLFIWHRFIQPFVLRFWNPWEKKDEQGNVIKDESFPFTCKGGSCPFPATKTKQETAGGGDGDNRTESTEQNTKEVAAEDKKND